MKVVTIFSEINDVLELTVLSFAKIGYNICIPTRNVRNVSYLKGFGFPGQITILQSDIMDYTQLISIVKVSDIVINAISIGKNYSIHKEDVSYLGLLLADYCQKYGVDRLIQITPFQSFNESLDEKNKTYSHSDIALKFSNVTTLHYGFLVGNSSLYINSICQIARFPIIFIPKLAKLKKIYPTSILDLAEGIVQSSLNEKTKGCVYNMHYSSEIKQIDLIKLVFKRLNSNIKIFFIPNFIAKLKFKICNLLPSQFLKTLIEIFDDFAIIPEKIVENKSYFETFNVKPRKLEDTIDNIIYGKADESLYNDSIKISDYY